MKKHSMQRDLIVNSLKNRIDHPTAEILYLDLKKQMPEIGIATVYRNLQNLLKEGKIIKIKTKDNVDRYDGNIEKHIHFECSKCGKLLDIFLEENQMKKLDNDMQELANTIQAKKESETIIINGICKNCK